MTSGRRLGHVVVDGSNIATEGRSMPSLTQLNDAVLAYMAEHPAVTVTVVVDATFGHRIDKSEVDEFDTAVANNELVAPPAGAIGRGDAFVLSIADKAEATVLSNDSFQEFHGEYEWLFDDGRLVGGKPVPHVGWVFVDRVPVRGPVSRKAVRDSKKSASSTRVKSSSSRRSSRSGSRRASKAASEPMPTPTAPPPGATATTVVDEAPEDGRGRTTSSKAVNELMPFLEFVEHHPVGTSVNAVVDSYSSHGAYVKIGDVLGYLPLRLMADPAPRRARDLFAIGDAVTLVVTSFSPERRSIDCAVPEVAAELDLDVEPDDLEGSDGERAREAPPRAKAASKRAAKKPATKKSAAKKAATKKSAAKKATKTAAKKAATKKAATKKSAVKKAPARKAASDTKQAVSKKTAARKASAKPRADVTSEPSPTTAPPVSGSAPSKATGEAARASEAAVPATERASTPVASDAPASESATTEQVTAEKPAAKKSTRRKSAARKTPAKKSAAKKPPAKKAAKKSPAKRSASKRSSSTKAAAKPASSEQPAGSSAAAADANTDSGSSS